MLIYTILLSTIDNNSRNLSMSALGSPPVKTTIGRMELRINCKLSFNLEKLLLILS